MPPKSKKAKQETVFKAAEKAAENQGSDDDSDMEVQEAGIGLEYNPGEEWDIEEDENVDETADSKSEAAESSSSEPSKKGKKAKGKEAAAPDDDKVIQVDFEFCDFKPSHFHSVKNLLCNFTPNVEKIRPAALSDIVIEQVFVGTTLTVTEQTDEAYGFITALNLHDHLKSPPIKELKAYLLKEAEKNASAEQLAEFKSILKSCDKPNGAVGLVLNERFVNLPLEVVPHLHQSLLDDIVWAQSSENEDATPKERKSFDFEHLILVSSCCFGNKGQDKDDVFFTKFEEEVYLQESRLSFPLSHIKVQEHLPEQAHSKMVLVIHKSKLPGVVKGIKELVGQPV